MRALGLALLLCGANASADLRHMTWDTAGYQAVVCELMELDCSAIPSPLLIVADFGKAINAYGLYPIGTNVVLLSGECYDRLADKTKCKAVLIHEVAHYVSYWLWPQMAKCDSESFAWLAHNRYVRDMMRRDLERTDWRKDYPEC